MLNRNNESAQLRQALVALVDHYNRIDGVSIWKPTWEQRPDGSFEPKFSIYFDYSEQKFKVDYLTCQRCPCILYFRTSEIAERFFIENHDLLTAYFGL